MSFDEGALAKIYCTACGMPHHEDCYQENGGCTVFGCARAPADDPKLQVSYSDLNAAAVAQPAAAVQQALASLPQSPSRYGGPLGLSNSVSGAGAAFPAPAPLYAQPPYMLRRPPKSRTTYIVLGVFLGAFGAHNFYAGYTGRAVGQLCLSILTLFYLSIASWIWAIVEICVVEKDSAGIQFS
jgi:TM2 domain-containing membrane protein YozV